MSVGGPVEGSWIVLNLTTLVISVWGFLDARRSAAAVKALNGHGPEIVAKGDQRREFVRILTQLALLILALPALDRPGDTPVSVPIVVLMSIAVLVFANTAGDAIDRRRLWKESSRRDRRPGDSQP